MQIRQEEAAGARCVAVRAVIEAKGMTGFERHLSCLHPLAPGRVVRLVAIETQVTGRPHFAPPLMQAYGAEVEAFFRSLRFVPL
jgi:hypothetical protein